VAYRPYACLKYHFKTKSTPLSDDWRSKYADHRLSSAQLGHRKRPSALRYLSVFEWFCQSLWHVTLYSHKCSATFRHVQYVTAYANDKHTQLYLCTRPTMSATSFPSLSPIHITHRQCLRDSTVELSRVGVGGVVCILGIKEQQYMSEVNRRQTSSRRISERRRGRKYTSVLGERRQKSNNTSRWLADCDVSSYVINVRVYNQLPVEGRDKMNVRVRLAGRSVHPHASGIITRLVSWSAKFRKRNLRCVINYGFSHNRVHMFTEDVKYHGAKYHAL